MFGNEKAHDAKFIMTYYVLRIKHSRHMMTRAMCEIVMLFQDHINLLPLSSCPVRPHQNRSPISYFLIFLVIEVHPMGILGPPLESTIVPVT